MLTPIKDNTKVNNSSYTIRQLLAKGTVIKTLCFYDGRPEFDLCDGNDYFVHAETSSEPIYLFWECLRRDGRRLYDFITCPDLNFEDENLFKVYQEKWNTYDSPHIRAAFFFILNRCSDSGKISSGQFSVENYSPVAVSRVKNFRFPENFHLSYKRQTMSQFLQQKTNEDTVLLISAGRFNYNLFNHGKNLGIEDVTIDHKLLADYMQKRKNKILTTYDYHRGVERYFKNCKFTLVDQYGKQTNNQDNAKEIIVANF